MRLPTSLLLVPALLAVEEPGSPRSSVAFRIPEPDLIPEGMTHDPVTGRFFVGSFAKRKIVQVDREGKATDFIREGQDGFLCSVGMRVDPKRRRLWANTCAAPHMKTRGPEVKEETGIYEYDVDSGRLLAKAMVPKTSEGHIFNDMTLDANGDLYVSGFGGDVIYRVDGKKCEATEFVRTPAGFEPNGIALSGDGRLLYVAGTTGVSIVDVASKAISRLRTPANVQTFDVDGLYWYENSLIAVQQNQPFPAAGSRVARFFLSDDGARVERLAVLDEKHPLHDQPTTGVVVGDRFYYIANSQFTKFDSKFVLAPIDRLASPAILEVKIAG